MLQLFAQKKCAVKNKAHKIPLKCFNSHFYVSAVALIYGNHNYLLFPEERLFLYFIFYELSAG